MRCKPHARFGRRPGETEQTATLSPRPGPTSPSRRGVGEGPTPSAAGDHLYAARRTLHTGAALLTDRQRERLTTLFTPIEHVEVEATWGCYQRLIAAYRDPEPRHGKELMHAAIGCLREGVPDSLVELRKLGRRLNARAEDVLA